MNDLGAASGGSTGSSFSNNGIYVGVGLMALAVAVVVAAVLRRRNGSAHEAALTKTAATSFVNPTYAADTSAPLDTYTSVDHAPPHDADLYGDATPAAVMHLPEPDYSEVCLCRVRFAGRWGEHLIAPSPLLVCAGPGGLGWVLAAGAGGSVTSLTSNEDCACLCACCESRRWCCCAAALPIERH
jgi:hypothetical protein